MSVPCLSREDSGKLAALTTEASTLVRWPGIRVILGCSAAASIAVAVDTYFSAQEGYLAQPPNYEGIGYLQFARTAYLLLGHLHIRAALHELNSIAPLWTVLQTLQYFIVVPVFAWLAKRAERREPVGWVPISRDRIESPTSQY